MPALVPHYYTYLGVTFSKKRTGDDTARLFHCHQLDNVLTARCRNLHTHGNICQTHACFLRFFFISYFSYERSYCDGLLVILNKT